MEIRSKSALETEATATAATAATEGAEDGAEAEAKANAEAEAEAAAAAAAAATEAEAVAAATAAKVQAATAATKTPGALNIDLFQVLIGQVDKISKLLGFHRWFPFLGETYVVLTLHNSLRHFTRPVVHKSCTKAV